MTVTCQAEINIRFQNEIRTYNFCNDLQVKHKKTGTVVYWKLLTTTNVALVLQSLEQMSHIATVTF